MKEHTILYRSMSHTYGEYGVFLPSVTWEIKGNRLYRTVKKRTTTYHLSDIEAISFFYGTAQRGPLRYYCRFRIRGKKWSGKQIFSMMKTDVEKGNGDPYTEFALKLVEKARSENPALQLQYGMTPKATFFFIVAAIVALSVPIMLHIGIGDSQATMYSASIIIPLVGIMVWQVFRHQLHTVAWGETIPQKVFPGPVQRLRNR